MFIILALCGVICYFEFTLGKQLAGNEENGNETNETTEKEDYNGELSLTDERVTRIIDKFHINYKDDFIDQYIYEREGLLEFDIMRLTIGNSKSYIKTENENACVTEQKKYYETDYMYDCDYINYDDLNKNYNSLTGKDLVKNDIDIGLTTLIYDDDKNIFRFVYVAGGGGESTWYISKLVKAEKQDDYIYIYEKAIIVGVDYGVDEGYVLTKISDYSNQIYDNEISVGPYTFDENNTDAHLDKMIEDHIDKFETFKWSFKLSSNGEYVYDSLTNLK